MLTLAVVAYGVVYRFIIVVLTPAQESDPRYSRKSKTRDGASSSPLVAGGKNNYQRVRPGGGVGKAAAFLNQPGPASGLVPGWWTKEPTSPTPDLVEDAERAEHGGGRRTGTALGRSRASPPIDVNRLL